MNKFFIFFMIIFYAGVLMAQSTDSSAVAGEETDYKGTDSTDSATVPAQEAAVRCTLEIKTIPDSATVLFNNAEMGTSPLTITDVDTGKHVIVLQKPGFYRKKAVVTVSGPQRLPLAFELTAPGRIALTTEPAGAEVVLNGIARGKTPYVDSVVKPAIYQLHLEMPTFETVEDSIVVGSGESVVRLDTLIHTAAYSDSVAYSAEISKVKKKRFTLGMILGAFGIFLMTILVIEGQDR